MRTICIAILTGCLVACAARAAVAQERQFGAKVGPAFASLSVDPGDPDVDLRGSLAAALAGFVVLPVARRTAVQLELLYVRKGAESDFAFVNTNGTSTFLLDYLEFPVLVRLTAGRRGAQSWHAFGGLSPAIRIRAEQEIAASLGGTRTGFADDISVEIGRFDVSVVGGAGVGIGRHVVVDGRYSWGLSDVSRDAPQGLEGRLPAGASVRNRAFILMAGFRY